MTLLISIFLPWLLAAHPIHVSVTSIEVNKGSREISIAQKFYTEDFSLLFYHLYEKNIRPESGKDFAPPELELIHKYISAAFILESGKTGLPLRFVRKDQDEESTWLYFTSELPSDKIRSLMLTNLLMLDLYEDQTNLVIVTDGVAEKGYTFDYNDRQMEIDIHGESASALASESEYIRAFAKNY
jgi:hypothetical protein